MVEEIENRQAIVRFDKDTEKFLLIDPKDGKVLHRVQELQWMQRTINNSTKCKQRGINEYAIEGEDGIIIAIFTRQEGGTFRRTWGNEPKVQSDGKLGSRSLQIAPRSSFPVAKRFIFMRKMIRMVRAKDCNGMIITGEGGLGKTWTIFDELVGMVEGVDFFWYSGFSTAKGLFELLKENRHAFMVFDDMDTAFKDKIGKDLLKAALDSTARKRMVTWASNSTVTESERSFEFKGTIIFLSNTPLMKIPQPIISRTIYVDLFMTPEEKIEHMTNILEAIRPDILGMDEKQQALDFLDNKKMEIKDLNIRTLIHVAKFIKHLGNDEEVDWEELSEYMTVGG